MASKTVWGLPCQLNTRQFAGYRPAIWSVWAKGDSRISPSTCVRGGHGYDRG
jgi:hypothetical protein